MNGPTAAHIEVAKVLAGPGGIVVSTRPGWPAAVVLVRPGSLSVEEWILLLASLRAATDAAIESLIADQCQDGPTREAVTNTVSEVASSIKPAIETKGLRTTGAMVAK